MIRKSCFHKKFSVETAFFYFLILEKNCTLIPQETNPQNHLFFLNQKRIFLRGEVILLALVYAP